MEYQQGDESVDASAGNIVLVANAKTGIQQWGFEAESRILPTPVIANGAV